MLGLGKHSEQFEKTVSQVARAITEVVCDGGEWAARMTGVSHRELNKALKLVVKDLFFDESLGLKAATLKDGTPVVVSHPNSPLVSIRKAMVGEEIGPNIATKDGWADLVELLGEVSARARIGLLQLLQQRTGQLVEMLYARFDYLCDAAAIQPRGQIPEHDFEHPIRGDVNIKALLKAGVLVGFAVVTERAFDAQLRFIPVDDQLEQLWKVGQFARTLV